MFTSDLTTGAVTDPSTGDAVDGISGTVDEAGVLCEITIEQFGDDHVGQWDCQVNEAPFRSGTDGRAMSSADDVSSSASSNQQFVNRSNY